ncbi:MAG TPA: type VI secretion system membrane subunit TssM, partial [Gammaproteobacteria bacterium]|nr:type VI secretion system membrane subunit TssM [Gammaproteobacteria bacterium]
KKQSDKSGARGLHELPWYIIIGPPGSGKTTALINSGLRFPLAEQMGQQPLKGIGGTRNCDWWFSDEAVLIDTAGRYTTQDSNQATDSEAWSGFLKLLRKHRPRQPINGVILSISLSELMMQSESERKQHAHTIKQRLQELYENLGIQFPVYVLFTKCDLIAGFNEYFDNLSSQERQQIWGMTFPTSDKLESQFNLNNFKEEFDALLRRLNDRLQWRLQEERDVSRRALILGFPSELAALKEMTCQLLDATFRPGNFDNTVNLRGVYFTSGTQEGTPIDRVMGSLAHNFGLDRQTVPSYSGQGKSFFLTQLFRHVIFPEAMLAGTNRAHEKKQSWIRRAAYSLALLTTVAATGLWTSQYTEINSEILAIDQYADEYEQAFSKVSQSNDPSALLTPLAILQRAQSSGIENRSIFSQSGLSQMHALGPATDDAYHRTLQQAFFPRLINLLEAALNQRENNLDNVFAALKTYLMLAYTEHFDEQQVSQWFVNYWENQFPGNIDKQTQLQQHLKTLFHIGFEPILINEALVKNSRKKLQKIPLANRIYRSLKQKGKNTLADFFLADILYAEEQPFYLNKQDSNEPLRGIPGLFTKAGYESLFLEESVKLAQATRQDDWIFGKGSAGEKEKIDTDALHKEV